MEGFTPGPASWGCTRSKRKGAEGPDVSALLPGGNKMAPTDRLPSERLRQQKPIKEEPEEPSWREEALHGMDNTQTEDGADMD